MCSVRVRCDAHSNWWKCKVSIAGHFSPTPRLPRRAQNHQRLALSARALRSIVRVGATDPPVRIGPRSAFSRRRRKPSSRSDGETLEKSSWRSHGSIAMTSARYWPRPAAAPPVSAEAARFLCARAFAGTPPAPAEAPPLAPPPLACTGSVNPSAWFNSELESLNESAPGLPKGESAPGL